MMKSDSQLASQRHKKLGQILLEMNCVTIRQLTEAIIDQRISRPGEAPRKIGETLVLSNVITAGQLKQALRLQEEGGNQNDSQLNQNFETLKKTVKNYRRTNRRSSASPQDSRNLISDFFFKLKNILTQVD